MCGTLFVAGGAYWGASPVLGSKLGQLKILNFSKIFYFFDFQQFAIGRKGDRVKNREKC